MSEQDERLRNLIIFKLPLTDKELWGSNPPPWKFILLVLLAILMILLLLAVICSPTPKL